MTDTEKSLVELIKKKYPDPRYAVIPQVRNAAGFNATRTADALAIGLWPSHGLHLHGFECKVSRSDWLNELKQPEKADAFAVYCDFWWVVTAPGIIEPGELPEPWGHLKRKGQRLVCVKEAPKNQDVQTFPRTMLAAMAKRQAAPEKEALDAAYNAGYQKAKKEKAGYEANAFERLRTKVREFEHASGLSIENTYEITQIGDAVRRVMAIDNVLEYRRRDFDRLHRQVKNLFEAIEEVRKPLDDGQVSA